MPSISDPTADNYGRKNTHTSGAHITDEAYLGIMELEEFDPEIVELDEAYQEMMELAEFDQEIVDLDEVYQEMMELESLEIIFS